MTTPEALNKEAVDLLIPFIEKEYGHFYLYKALANWATDNGYLKAGAFFEKESQEEAEHAASLQKFLVDWNIQPPLPSIKAPKQSFANLLEVIEAAYDAELALYHDYDSMSHEMCEISVPTFDFLGRYREIQRTTVAEYSDKLNILNGCNEDSKFEMLMLEEKLFS